MKEFDLTDFIKKAKKEYEESFSFGDQILYDMCKKYPAHNKEEKGIIMSKVWLIGRSYAAALERTRDGRKDIYNKLAKKNLEEIDKRIEKLKNYQTIDNTNIEVILNLHHELVKIYNDVSGLNKISLASKYLHFHLPNLFYIYDSRANDAITKITKETGRLKKSEKISQENTAYAKFFNKVYIFQNKLKSITKTKYSPRDIDCILLHYKDSNDKDKEKFNKSIKVK